ncbi:MAG: nucleotidyltransferase family protein [Bilifractor sp.]|jgi:NDP-sugar pyrophosphorylase family protein
MKKPMLVIMAAGMGSRYGGLKQMDPVDDEGHLIIDFSIFDAISAGFEDIVFIIKRENEKMFREVIGDRIARKANVHYVFQSLDNLPEGYSVPEGRVKPWGTGHAVLSCIDTIHDSPFAVINADDFYGKNAFRLIFDFLTTNGPDQKDHYAMVGYRVGNTVTENGSVARGVCRTDENGYLTEITERTRIEKREGNRIAYTEDDGKTWVELPYDTVVSMNMWGFSGRLLDELQARFPVFLDRAVKENPLNGEYFLPFVVEELLKEKRADVRVLPTPDRWYGVTYREDKPFVVRALGDMKKAGEYQGL